ncbi:redoxin domain-containing protein [Prevotella sp. E2-28]|uniref:TlpA family protein disulfide reductase n=1 Tax=Prevotella sp. E2-28 TaxID=2913620 RepID=UPI001EDB48C3|nr:redoxin domain-containing protein [Prevotella sp. E2-28]UKK53971.1 redoxin domain-containing protein [Prevotella sp. E2-28]
MKKAILTIIFVLLLAPLSIEAESKKKVKESEVPQMMNYPSAELSEFRLHGGNVVVQGHFVVPEEAKGEKVPQEVLDQINGRFTVIMRDYIVRKEKTSVIEFTPDGTFSMNVYVPYPMQLLIYPLRTVYGCPGDTITVAIDLTKKTKEEAVTFDGTGLSGEVTRLMQVVDDKYCKPDWSNKVYEKGPDSLMLWKDDQVAQLDELIRQMNGWSSESHRASTNGRVVTDDGKANNGLPELAGCSPLASDILRTHILAQRLEHICDYYMRGMSNFRWKDPSDMKTYWQQYFSFVAPRAKYLTDNPLLMIAGDDFFFNRVEYAAFEPINASRTMANLPFDYNQAFADALAKEKTQTPREFRMNTMKELQEKLHVSPTDFSAQVCHLRSAFSTLKWLGDRYDQAADEVAAAMSVVSHPDLIRQGLLTFREYIKDNEIKVVEDKPMTKGDSIFQRIIEPYKGNVLYVDFWEMSCGPCRGGMLQMRDELEANKDKPVKYLYVTDDSPEKCKSFLEPNNIKGEHIHISRSEWGYLQEKFQFTGIPFVVLFDKQGKQRNDVTVDQLLNE